MTGCALLTRLAELIDKLHGQALLLRDRTRHAEAAQHPSLQPRLAAKRQRWQSLWALWRSCTRVPPPVRFLLPDGESEDPRAIANSLATYWGDVATTPLLNDEDCADRDLLLREVSAHFVPITWPDRPFASSSDFKNRLKHAPSTCPGPDGVRFAHLKGLGEPLCELIAELFNSWMADGTWIPLLSDTHFVALLKPNATECPTPSSIRPIALTNCAGKLLTAHLAGWLASIVPPHIASIQHGFLAGRGTAEALLEIEYHSLTRSPLSDEHMLLLLDVSRAFPSLLHTYIMECLAGASAPQWLCLAIKSLYGSLSGKFVFHGCASHSFKLARGVRQGCPLSSLIFAWAVDGVLRWAISKAPWRTHLSAFADDLAIPIAKSLECIRFLHAFEKILSRVCGLDSTLNSIMARSFVFLYPGPSALGALSSWQLLDRVGRLFSRVRWPLTWDMLSAHSYLQGCGIRSRRGSHIEPLLFQILRLGHQLCYFLLKVFFGLVPPIN